MQSQFLIALYSILFLIAVFSIADPDVDSYPASYYAPSIFSLDDENEEANFDFDPIKKSAIWQRLLQINATAQALLLPCF